MRWRAPESCWPRTPARRAPLDQPAPVPLTSRTNEREAAHNMVFDRPLFKKLASNDTASTGGHQGGILIPKDLGEYFPDLEGQAISRSSPTADEEISVELFVGSVPLGTVSTRYQFQTWGNTRSPERRITGNLGDIRNVAKADDILLIERSAIDSKAYRMRLIRAEDPDYQHFESLTSGRRWGPLNKLEPPATEQSVTDAIAEQSTHQEMPLELFDNAAAFKEVWTKSVARSRAFQKVVTTLYAHTCALCGCGLRSVGGLAEVEAAHIVPRGLKGADDARNGLSLCRSHHWAFDRGLFGVTDKYAISIPADVMQVPQNISLNDFHSKKLRLPATEHLWPSPEALSWHSKNVVAKNF